MRLLRSARQRRRVCPHRSDPLRGPRSVSAPRSKCANHARRQPDEVAISCALARASPDHRWSPSIQPFDKLMAQREASASSTLPQAGSLTILRRAVCAVVVACSFAISLAYVGPSHGDDVFIYMRYAANLLQDGTIQYNLGEKSDGITSGAYFLIMSGIALLFGNVLVVWKMASACFYAAAIGIFFWATSKNQKRLEVSALLASTLALEPHLLRWSA